MEKNTKVISSVLKAFDVLELISESGAEGMTVTEISTAMGSGVSATYHLLNTLRSRDYINQNPKNKRYTLGNSLMALCTAPSQEHMLKDLAYSYLKDLTDCYNETSNLIILTGQEIEYVAQVESKRLIRMFTTMGARVPFYCTGGGKAIFAYKPEEIQDALTKDLGFQSFTKNTITSAKALKQEADTIRKRGYSLDNEERELGTKCIAAPVFARDGYPIAAISLSCPTYRMDKPTEKKMIASVTEAADKLSRDLGYDGNPFPASNKKGEKNG